MLGAVVFGSEPRQIESTERRRSSVATSPPVCLPVFDLHGKEIYPELRFNPRQSLAI